MKKFNKIISGALAALMIFTSVPVYAVNDVSTGTNTEISTETEENTSETISNGTEEIIDLSEISTEETATTENPVIEDKPTVFVESDENLEETDNWELGVVFYDSTVENGTKPLTEINWDASDGGYKEGTPRVITVQINYKNTNAVTTYQPGELEISIPNIANNISNFLIYNVTVGANDSTHSGYDWNFTSGNAPSNQGYYVFENAITIEEKTNFEGSIQIVYKLTPKKLTHSYKDEYTESLSKDINAILRYKNTQQQIISEETVTSPDYPQLSNFIQNDVRTWEYSNPDAQRLELQFTNDSTLGLYNLLEITDKFDSLLYTIKSKPEDMVYSINSDYFKMTLKPATTSYPEYKFSVKITAITGLIQSNTIKFNYERTYVHPWEY